MSSLVGDARLKLSKRDVVYASQHSSVLIFSPAVG